MTCHNILIHLFYYIYIVLTGEFHINPTWPFQLSFQDQVFQTETNIYKELQKKGKLTSSNTIH